MTLKSDSQIDDVRHIASTWDGDYVAVAAFERRVAVWNVSAGEKISEFDSCLDFGGRRLVITSDGRYTCAGAYERHGIACYESKTGNVVWQRRDLKKVQYMTIPQDGLSVVCGFDTRASRQLSIATGKDIATSRGVKNIYCSPYGGYQLIEKKSASIELSSLDQPKRAMPSMLSFALLDVAFSPSSVAVSEAGGPLRCFALDSTEELWRYFVEGGSHTLRLCYIEPLKLFAGILWSYVSGGNDVLALFDPQTGKVERSTELPDAGEIAFCKRGCVLVRWDGTVINVLSGERINKLAFTHSAGD